MPAPLKKAYRRVVRRANGIGLRIAYFDAETGQELTSLDGYTIITQDTVPPFGTGFPTTPQAPAPVSGVGYSGSVSPTSNSDGNPLEEFQNRPGASRGTGNLLEDLKTAFGNLKGNIDKFKEDAMTTLFGGGNKKETPKNVSGIGPGATFEQVDTFNKTGMLPQDQKPKTGSGPFSSVPIFGKALNIMAGDQVEQFLQGDVKQNVINMIKAAPKEVIANIIDTIKPVENPSLFNPKTSDLTAFVGGPQKALINEIQKIPDAVFQQAVERFKASTQESQALTASMSAPVPAIKSASLKKKTDTTNTTANFIDISDQATNKKIADRHSDILGVVFHHTAGSSLEGAVNSGTTAAHFYIDRDGTIYQLVDEDKTVVHIREPNSQYRTDKNQPTNILTNDNTIGVEIVAPDSDSFTPEQRKAADSLANEMAKRYPTIKPEFVVGHGEIQGGDGGNKIQTEGVNVAMDYRNNPYTQSPMVAALPNQDAVDYINPRLKQAIDNLSKKITEVNAAPASWLDAPAEKPIVSEITAPEAPAALVAPSSQGSALRAGQTMVDDLMSALPNVAKFAAGPVETISDTIETMSTGIIPRTSAPFAPTSATKPESLKELTGPYSLNDPARQAAVVHTMLGEAAGEGVEGLLAIANVIKNRAASGDFPPDPKDVALQSNPNGIHQFSAWNNPSKGGNSPAQRYPVGSPEYKKALQIAQGVFNGSLPDNTYGSLFYHTTGITPYWADDVNKQGILNIGNHVFYPQEKPEPTFTNKKIDPVSSVSYSASKLERDLPSSSFMTKNIPQNTSPVNTTGYTQPSSPASSNDKLSKPASFVPSGGSNTDVGPTTYVNQPTNTSQITNTSKSSSDKNTSSSGFMSGPSTQAPKVTTSSSGTSGTVKTSNSTSSSDKKKN